MTHRITGVLIFLGMAKMILLTAFSVQGNDIHTTISSMFTWYISKITLKLWIGCIYYHCFNGFRHMMWNAGLGISRKGIAISGIVVVSLAVVAALLT